MDMGLERGIKARELEFHLLPTFNLTSLSHSACFQPPCPRSESTTLNPPHLPLLNLSIDFVLIPKANLSEDSRTPAIANGVWQKWVALR